MPSWWNPAEKFQEILRTTFAELAEELANSAMEFTSEYITTPTNMAEKIPNFNELIWGTVAIGEVLCIILFYKRLLFAMRDMATDEDDPNFLEIVGSTAISMGMIVSFVPFVEKVLIPISNQMVEWISTFPVEFGEIDTILPTVAGDLTTASLHLLLGALIWSIGFFFLTLAGMFRIAHLTVALIAGPILMASFTNRSAIIKTYSTELIAIIFTQPIHMLIYCMVIWLGAEGTFESLMLSLVFIVVGITGPYVLKSYIQGMGVSGGATNLGKMGAYKVMMSGFKR